ncbi:flavodoxin-dependent (E)-4-hydroxy-3-methylbut-2-enyl-diphosphate synthase [Phorcysia thermohydrogeniphila]|uniref:4-hydroxy-3-methylbut-2-en-1-yl diphosphate synthase (flavodoxin) n=1 Tax=Phorcysia thermohydrogeniphila TaxID=936138 RepID=A0A4R1GEA7_9BACT|nr:flavodoxin-dependent (E)-4-hydroxy-3-methylbut-2-enyl-diphosphate synthase [Phorcysia thermohydrogeniphila]TCK06268.1 4-hydroxy-3-methylbut-2-en-1-yl diphosphate synthase [Phorcysia thermohydrogeniphila]
MSWIERRKTRTVYVGNVPIGSEHPIVVQSMTNTFTEDVETTVAQIKELERVGCEIVRVAVPSVKAAEAIREIKKRISIPLVADVHFDHRLALLSIENGADCVRINPGNIGAEWKVKEVIALAKERGISIRIGVNSGSIPKNILAKYGKPSPEALAETAINYAKFFEDCSFTNIKFSIKGSEVKSTVIANKIFAEKTDYPLHIGITEAGTLLSGAVKSAIGVGILLYEGIGDTIRISLSAHPKEEVRVAYKILSALELRKRGVEVISCPTCGRCSVDVETIAHEVEERLSHIRKPLKVAVMGCAVNGPGEAKFADVGIAGAGDHFILFLKGKVIDKLTQEEALERLVEEVEKLAEEEC